MILFLILGCDGLTKILVSCHRGVCKIFSFVNGLLGGLANMDRCLKVRLPQAQVDDINASGFILTGLGGHGKGGGFFNGFDAVGQSIHSIIVSDR